MMTTEWVAEVPAVREALNRWKDPAATARPAELRQALLALEAVPPDVLTAVMVGRVLRYHGVRKIDRNYGVLYVGIRPTS